MAIFQWKGLQGSQATNGEIEALNAVEAAKKLKEQKIIVTNIVLISGKEEKSPTGEESSQNAVQPLKKKAYKGKKIKLKDLLVFTKKFATMVQSGLPILKTLKMLESQQEDKNFKWVVHSIAEDVEGGATLSQAFGEHPTVFDTIYVNLIKAGESSGKLTTFLHKLVIQIDKAEKIRKKVKGALRYPIILLSVAFCVILVMMIKVVPVFQNMFSTMGHDLPAPTQLIIDISEFFRDPARGGLFIGTIAGSIFLFKYLLKNNMKVKRAFDKYILRAPLIGDIMLKSTLSKIAMIQGNLSAAGVAVLQSIDITIDTIPNTVFTEALKEVREGVSSGNNLSALYSTNPIFPPTFYQMLAVGEETGNMDEMFETTAEYYEEEFDMAVDRLTEALEPIMIIFMGITVGFIIVAMYMPIFQMGSMISH